MDPMCESVLSQTPAEHGVMGWPRPSLGHAGHLLLILPKESKEVPENLQELFIKLDLEVIKISPFCVCSASREQ